MGTRIVLLGRLAIEREGDSMRSGGLSGRRAEVVFAYLAAEHRRSVSREELADELWPYRLPDTWNAALRGVLTDVRRFLEGAGLDPAEVLVTEGGNLRLRLPDDAIVDIDEVRGALARACELLAAGGSADAAAAAGHQEWPATRRAFETWLDPANFDAEGRQRRGLAEVRGRPVGSV